MITYFDRSNREELPRIIGVLAREIAGGGKSVMIHVEGTRALTCRAPVQKMSGAFLDMAIATGAPVVPVVSRAGSGRAADGQARVPGRDGRPGDHDRRSDPAGGAGGAAVQGAQGAGDRRDQRPRPRGCRRGPLPPDPGFAAAAGAWAARTGASPEHAALFETLRRLEFPGAEMSRLLEGASAGRLALPDDERGRWLAELARRLYGPRGPAVTFGGRGEVICLSGG